MATRHNRRIKRKSRRGGMLSFLRKQGRKHDVYHSASASEAAREIKNLFAKGYPLDEESDKIFSEILGRHYSDRGRQNVVIELKKYLHESSPPQNIMQAVVETQRRIV